ncbi:MAG: transposase family protein [Marinilabiliaceae bacterium]|nr:transposase family protein [Marinilabiliaceae bacterium]
MQDFSAPNDCEKTLFLSSFSTLKDPRRQSTGNFRHQIMDMIFLVISAVVSGAVDWKHIETFGKSQLN